jgi:hypothetical protein
MDRKRSLDDKVPSQHSHHNPHGQGQQKRSRGRPRQNKPPLITEMNIPLLESIAMSGISGSEKLTQQIFAALMTNDPLNLNDIVLVTRTHMSVEAVQSLLDVMYLLGVVEKLCLQSDKPESLSGYVDTTSLPTVYYTLKGYCRCSEGVDVRKINTSKVLEAKTSSIEALEQRIETLHALTNKEMTVRERTCALKEFVHSSLSQNELLGMDPLYNLLKTALSSAV